MAHPLTLVLTGATGYVGRAILRRAAATDRPHRILALARRGGALADEPGLTGRVEVVEGALPAIPGGLIPAGPHVVLHFAAKQIDTDGTGYERTNVEGTRALLAACGDATRGVILSSSLSVLGQGAQRGVTEDAPPAPGTALAQSRARAEALVTEAMTARGRPALCVRPRFVLGGDDRFVMPAFRGLARRGLRVGSGRQRYAVIHVEDYAEAILRLAEGMAHGAIDRRGPLHVGYREPLSYDALTGALREGPPPRARIPVPVPRFLPRVLRALGAGSVATRLELVGLDHYARTDAFGALVGPDLWDRDPARALFAPLAASPVAC